MTDKKTWAKCVAAWRASGESATVFAAREGYAASSLRLVVIPHGVEIYLGVEPIDLRWASTGSAAWSPIGSGDARQVEPPALFGSRDGHHPSGVMAIALETWMIEERPRCADGVRQVFDPSQPPGVRVTSEEESMAIKVLDWRKNQLNPPALVRGVRKHKLGPNGKAVERDPGKIDGIVIHQTACTFGPSDDAQRRHERAFGVACHALAFRDGTVVLPNPLTWLVWHGNGFNDRSLGLECEGLLPGLRDDPSTVPREDLQTTWNGKPDDVTKLLVKTCQEALVQLVTLAKKEGIHIRYIWAHRQSSGTRRADPGQEIWERVVLDFAVPKLGLVTEPAMWLPAKSKGKPSNGRPIPTTWDPNGVGKY